MGDCEAMTMKNLVGIIERYTFERNNSMIWVGSAVAGNGEKLSDEMFRVLSETGEGLGWEAMENAAFYVHKHEWKSIAYLLSVAYEGEERGQEEWEYSVSSARKWKTLYRYLVDLTMAAHQVKNNQGVQQMLEEYLIMPMGLYVMPDSGWGPLAGPMPIVVR